MCDCHDNHEPEAKPLGRRMVLAGGLAGGVAALLPRIAGAQEAGDTTTSTSSTTTSTTAPTTTTTTPPLSPEGWDPPASGADAAADYAFLPPRPASEKHVRPMMFPVLPNGSQKATWSDTYLAPRSGGRQHEGQDLMGAKMLKLLAVTNGTIVELRYQSSGNSLYLKGDDGWYYCYLHINNDDPGTDNGANQFKYAFAPGMAIGKRVLKGDHIAYLGDSGNAEATGAHCHFEIRMPNTKWYNAAAVNAKYSLEAAEPAKLRPKVPDSAFAPHANAGAFAMVNIGDYLGSSPSSSFFANSIEELEGDEVGLDEWIESLLGQYNATNISAPVIRLYLAYYLRIPDFEGLDYWIRQVRAGTSLDKVSSTFAGGSEFIRRYGSLDNEAFLIQIYNNVFGRNPDSEGLDYWKRRLDGGWARGKVMRQMCESSEYKRKTASQVRVIQVHAAMLQKKPSDSEYKRWADWDGATPTGLRDCIKYLRTSDAYAARFSS